jgi:rubrerythrin
LNVKIKEEIHSKMDKTSEGQWYCLVCRYESAKKSHVFEHIEAKHIDHPGYSCPICGRLLKNSIALRRHKCGKVKGGGFIGSFF